MNTPLTHNQVIRVKGFRNTSARIRVRTQEGIIAQYGDKPTNQHGELAWTHRDTSVLTADYPGKAAELDAKRAEIAAAVELEHGQSVQIEGRNYTVRVNGESFSDPVAFLPL
jgi:hypothetical protein